RKILVAVDGSLNSKRAAKAAIALAKTLKTDLGIIHVVQIPGIAYTAGMPIAIGEIQTGLREAGEKYISEAASLAEKSGVGVQREVLMDMFITPAQGITEYADRHKFDLI